MSTATRTSTSGTGMDTGEAHPAMQTIRRGVELSPELTDGLRGTLAFAVLSTLGRIVVPVAVQQVIDKGVNAPGGPDMRFVGVVVTLAAVAVLVTSLATYKMTYRLFSSAERGLATLRTKAFRHVHDLPLLTQNTERRGALVSRVTSDVDQVSQFLVFGGVISIVSVGQVIVATIVMAVYSWQLTIVVWVCFLPLFLSLRYFQQRLSAAYGIVRQQVGVMLSKVSEPVVGAATVRSYAIERRTQERIDEAIERYKQASTKAQGLTAFSFSLGGVSAGLANAGVLVVGVLLGVDGQITAGKVLAFAFLVSLFVGPVQIGTQVLTDAQNAIAGWRRVIGILDTPADVVDPGETGTVLPREAVTISFDDVGFAYPGGAPVLHDIDLEIAPNTRVAVVGETGSGKTTLAKLLTRLMDPTSGVVRLDGVDLRDVPFAYGKPGMTDAHVAAAFDELGLGAWVQGLADGVATRVGQRGESLSAGERQLVALVRAHLADPDLLVLDEATSAVDPALEMRISRALERLQRGRTSVTIAHRMSTAENADEVVVVDKGRIVQRGPHARLVTEGGVYGRLHASWVAQQSVH